MPKDYAKKGSAKKANPLFNSMTFWAVLFALLVVLVLYGYRYFHHAELMSETLPPVRTGEPVKMSVYSTGEKGVVSEAETKPAPESASENPAPQAKAKARSQPIQYEFYSMLPEMTVGSEQVKTDTGATKQAVVTESSPGYWLQIAAYYTKDAAEGYQSRVQLLGLDATIVESLPSDKGSHTVYRVEVGPLESYSEAKIKQAELAQMKLNSLIRKNS
jgi:cell division protein FtsN